jgi:hypothetical protein
MTPATTHNKTAWPPQITVEVINIVEEIIHDLDPVRRRARKRTEQAIQAARQKDDHGGNHHKRQPLKRTKKEPIGWISPVKAKGSGTSLGKGRWRVIDSTGQWIASGFATCAYALRWIDGFKLMRAGYHPEDEQWIFLHWYPARPVRRAPKPRASIETRKANVLTTKETEVTKAQRPLETAAINPGKCDP